MRQVVFEGITFTDCGEPNVTEEALDKYEKEKRTKLPEDYRQFLIQVNGGTPNPCGCKCLSSSALKPGNNFDIKGLNKILRYYPKNLKANAKEFWERAYLPTRIDKFFPFSRSNKPAATIQWFDILFFQTTPIHVL